MNQDAIFTLTRLYLDVRLLCGEGEAPPDERFQEALALIDGSRAGDWMRYCCETMRVLVVSDRRAAYDFADAVHNTRHLKGLEDGLLLWPKSYWDIEIEAFREKYGQAYFSDFTDCVIPDEEIERRYPDVPRGEVQPTRSGGIPLKRRLRALLKALKRRPA